MQSTYTRIAIDVGIVVANMERSLRFYRDLLGLPVVAEASTSLIGTGRMMQLAHGESLVKLVELDESPSQRSPTGVGASLGYRYITLLVSDIAATMTHVEAGGVTVALPVTRLDHGATIAMVEDPDGNIVEFVQETS